MGRPRTPTAVLKLRGSYKKHPERLKDREDEPEPEGGLGPAPEFFDEALKARWKEIREAANWLTSADRLIVEQTCRLIMKERNGDATPGHSRLLAMNLRQLGMTPSDRSRVKVPGGSKQKGKPKNGFAALG